MRFQQAVLILASASVCPSLWSQVGGFGGVGGFGAMPMANVANVQGFGGGPQSGFGIRPFIFVNGLYTTNLQVTSTEPLARDFYSAGLRWGLTGYKQWNRTSMALTYSGAVRYFDRALVDRRITNNQFGAVGISQVLGPRTNLNLSILGGSAWGGYGYGGGFGGIGPFAGFAPARFSRDTAVFEQNLNDPNSNGLIDNEITDDRVDFLASHVGLSHRLSERWFVNAGGGIFYVNRATGLIDSRGVNATGSVGYVIDAQSQVNVQYSHAEFRYPGNFNGVNVNFLTLGYTRQFTPTTTFSGFVGASYVKSDFVGVVPLSPELAALLGQTTGIAIQKMSRLGSVFGFRLMQRFPVGTLSAFYTRGIVPGSGALFASGRDSAGLSYSLHPADGWTWGVQSSFFHTEGLFQNKTTNSFQVSSSVNHRLWRDTFMSFSAGYRTFFGDLVGIRRQQLFFSVGIGWNPGDNLLSF